MPMHADAPIRILASPVQTGDLFGRLVADLFLALGYDQPRLNIHKTGREIDIQAHHRTEPRSVRAECKATAKPIGGDAINKFAGALERERRRNPKEEICGYFISLAGFSESAREQELEGGDPPRLTCLDGDQITTELITGRILVSRERALERAGRCAARVALDLVADQRPQLLAHEIGWIWAVRFQQHKELSHLALIHADGDSLSPRQAQRIIDQDRRARADLHLLLYLPPEIVHRERSERLAEARQAYFSYLAAECGYLELEGLPADEDVGSRRLRLESLFVPLRLLPVTASAKQEGERVVPPEETRSVPIPVGEALAAQPRLAILALPGAGKTTLIKRLASAYAFPERRIDLGDHLPNREWFPLLLRCRQLRGRTGEPIIRLLGQVGERAELGDLVEAFQTLVQITLREGRALLLIDGLDEISDPRERTTFVTQVRTFLSTYPWAEAVITSREAGFRSVAGALAGHCAHYRIAELDREDVERLTVAWHREVVGRRSEVDAQARDLAKAIWETDRTRRLAINPLLLTTLLLVRRWVGQLPSRRSVLYDKAIEVLLWTWNVQGHEQLDLHEVVPQLAFLAWQMMEEPTQRISQPRLTVTLQAARRQMPDVLSHARLTIGELIERVEGRSSLLVIAGHEIEDGRLVPIYEFQHLTFQEFLAAKALVEGYYPDQMASETLTSKLQPHFEDESWKEVIPLVAALSGRKAAPLTQTLVERGEERLLVASRYDHSSPSGPRPIDVIPSLAPGILTQCLLDDVQVAPDQLERALVGIVRSDSSQVLVYQLAAGKYGDLLRKLIWQEFLAEDSRFFSLANSLRVAGYAKSGWPQEPELTPAFVVALGLLSTRMSPEELGSASNLPGWMQTAVSAIESSHTWEQFLGAWALALLGQAEIQPAASGKVLQRILDLLSSTEAQDLRYACSWILLQVPPPSPRSLFRVPCPADIARVTRSGIEGLIAAFYWRQPWTDE